MEQISGINMDEGLRRTGNHPALYLRFLKRFPEDPSFSALQNALLSGRIRDAFLCAHTLKGLTAQLGITALRDPTVELCELLRHESGALPSRALELLDAMTPVYHDIVRQISAIL